MTERLLMQKPEGLHCETKIPVVANGKPTNMRMECPHPATHIYGPACEEQTGKLMYLCDGHAAMIQEWRSKHLYDPVNCPTHGHLGPVKTNLVLKKMVTL
jgi:hypothetical protein